MRVGVEAGGPGPEGGGAPRARLGWRPAAWGARMRGREDDADSLAEGPESVAGRGGPSNGGEEACSPWALGGLAEGWARLAAARPLVSKTRVGIAGTDGGNGREQSEGPGRTGLPAQGTGGPGPDRRWLRGGVEAWAEVGVYHRPGQAQA